MASDSWANNGFEFEARHKEDFSWHPCSVSLRPNGAGLTLNYEDNDTEDIEDKEEVLNCLRLCSVPSCVNDCSKIQQGNRVLATQLLQNKSLFFDAEVEEKMLMVTRKAVEAKRSQVLQ